MVPVLPRPKMVVLEVAPEWLLLMLLFSSSPSHSACTLLSSLVSFIITMGTHSLLQSWHNRFWCARRVTPQSKLIFQRYSRASEDPEHRRLRLAREREHVRIKRMNETPEAKAERRRREMEKKRLKRGMASASSSSSAATSPSIAATTTTTIVVGPGGTGMFIDLLK